MQIFDEQIGAPESRGYEMRSKSSAPKASLDAPAASNARSRGTLTRQEIAHAVYSAYPGFSRSEAKTFVDAVLEEIVSTLVGGGRREASRFRQFRRSLKGRAPRAQSEDWGQRADLRPQGCHLQSVGSPKDRGERRMSYWFVAGK